MKNKLRKMSFVICMLKSLPLFGAANIVSTEEGSDNKTLWFEAVNLNNLELVELLAAEVGVNTQDGDGNTALHLAISHNHVDLINLLIKHKADLNAVNNKMESILDLAKKSSYLELLKKHIDELKDKSESTRIVTELMRLGKKKRKVIEDLDEDGVVVKKEDDVTGNGHVEKKHKGDKKAEKPFKCDQCDKSFRHKSNLTQHKLIHTEDKPFKCEQCEYVCRQKSNLKTHKQTHTGKKPFKCDECDRAFITNQQLITHKRIHTGEKPFKCDQCDHTCSDKSSLIQHKSTHTGAKLFKCDQCDYAYKHKSNLSRHKQKHLNDIVVKKEDEKKEEKKEQ